MKYWLVAGCLSVCLVTSLSAAAKGPEIDLVDNKLSINADSIPLGRLLRLLDLATGMQSKVPPDLAGRSISVKFSGLPLEDGLRKIFQGQPIDYVVVSGQGVIVTAISQTLGAPESASANNSQQPPAQSFPQQPPDQAFTQEFPAAGVVQPGVPVPGQPPIPGQPVIPGMPQQQPAMIQTPFGPIANPRAGQPIQTPPPAPQQNTLFPGSLQQPVAPQAAPAPFGNASPFGMQQPNSNNSNNSLFGSPTVLTPGSTQPR
jgi:hypothetical protein